MEHTRSYFGFACEIWIDELMIEYIEQHFSTPQIFGLVMVSVGTALFLVLTYISIKRERKR